MTTASDGETKSTGQFGSREKNFLAPFMIHELLPSLTETASGSHPCCIVSVTYGRSFFTAVKRGQIPPGTPNRFWSIRGTATFGGGPKREQYAAHFSPASLNRQNIRPF